ncbi:hypothetical protein [Acidithiobacillus sp. AMEEHan]|uniref:hypothetical protein n=1 Tax=Acidithiobacillus sp. AMEEHan TaxID=2994951 RepID=UPI0027E42A2E|nr:hypothetical protein [Acidithiobacillus sp. AMEEHan]
MNIDEFFEKTKNFVNWEHFCSSHSGDDLHYLWESVNCAPMSHEERRETFIAIVQKLTEENRLVFLFPKNSGDRCRLRPMRVTLLALEGGLGDTLQNFLLRLIGAGFQIPLSIINVIPEGIRIESGIPRGPDKENAA